MANRSGFLALVEGVQAHFERNGLTAHVAPATWGRERYKHVNQGPGGANRVLFLRGREGGAIGSFVAPQNTSREPRPLAGLDGLVTMSV
jgi:hypothetical protein